MSYILHFIVVTTSKLKLELVIQHASDTLPNKLLLMFILTDFMFMLASIKVFEKNIWRATHTSTLKVSFLKSRFRMNRRNVKELCFLYNVKTLFA